METDTIRLTHDRLQAFVTRLMQAAGVDADQIAAVSENLLWNDAAGRRNHGVERLPILLRRVRAGLIKCPAEIRFRDLGPSMAHLDADDAFGQYAGLLAVDRAIAMARDTGLGAVGVSSSNFYGTGAFFVARISDAGMVGLALSNSFPKVATEGGCRAVLGTNPFAFGAPGRDGRRLLLDMSTAAAAGSSIREAREAGTSIPEGIAVGADGLPVTDPALALSATLLPAAGAKGFGLALMVEMLAGVLTGSGIAGGVGSLYKDFTRPSDNGHFFLALDISRWMEREVWDARFEMLAQAVAEGGGRFPGDHREQMLAESRAKGVPVSRGALAALNELATGFGVPPLA